MRILSDDEFKSEIASHAFDGGLPTLMELTDNDSEMASELAEGGWSSVYEYVSDIHIDTLNEKYDFLLEEENYESTSIVYENDYDDDEDEDTFDYDEDNDDYDY